MNILSNPVSALKSVHRKINEITFHTKFKLETSGCTSISLLLTVDEFHIANLGDSRVFIGQ